MTTADRSQYVFPLQGRAGEQPFANARQQLDAMCQTVAVGRLAARQLALHARSVGLNEAEFRLLWQLGKSSTAPEQPDQKQLATQLGLSAAQVSTVVERLRVQGFVAGKISPSDRRRQVWRITNSGSALLDASLARIIAHLDSANESHSSGAVLSEREEDVA